MRDNSGRFIKGQSGNPKGRPKKKVEESYYQVTQSSVSLEDWALVVIKALEQAKNGDRDARKFIAEYLMGKPDQYLEVEGILDFEIEWPEIEE